MYLEPKWCPLFCTWSLGIVLEGFFQPKNREFKPNRFQIPVFYKKIAAGWLHQFPFAGIEQTFAGPHSWGQVDASVYNTVIPLAAYSSYIVEMVVSNIFYVHPYLGKIPILTIIFFNWVETTN